jgi:hypothetical protein
MAVHARCIRCAGRHITPVAPPDKWRERSPGVRPCRTHHQLTVTFDGAALIEQTARILADEESANNVQPPGCASQRTNFELNNGPSQQGIPTCAIPASAHARQRWRLLFKPIPSPRSASRSGMCPTGPPSYRFDTVSRGQSGAPDRWGSAGSLADR